MRRRLLLCAVLLGLLAPAALISPPAATGAPSAEALAPRLRVFTYNPDTFTVAQQSEAAALVGTARAGEIAIGDVDGDGSADTLLSGGTSGGLVEVREADGNMFTLRPFGTGYAGGLTVATGNLDGDTPAEIVVGSANESPPRFRVFNADGTPVGPEVAAYEPGFVGGVRVAVGDVDGNGVSEVVTAPGFGRASTVKVFTPAGALVSSFDAFATTFLGGATIAVENIDGDAREEVVVGAGPGGGPHVIAFDNGTAQTEFVAFNPATNTGTRVAAGVVGGAPAIVVTGRTNGAPEVRIFFLTDGQSGGGGTQRSILVSTNGDLAPAIRNGDVLTIDAAPRLIAVDPANVLDHTRGRVRVYGAGLATIATFVRAGDGNDNLVTRFEPVGHDDVDLVLAVPAGYPTGAKSLEIRDGTRFVAGLGFSVAARQVELDALVTTGVARAGGPHVREFSSDGASDGFFAGPGTATTGVRVARGDLTGDGIDEIVTGSGPEHPPTVRVFSPEGDLVRSFDAYAPNFLGGVFVAVGDVDGDGDNEIATGPGAGGGPHVRAFNAQGAPIGDLSAYAPTFHGGVNVATGDVDGDGVQEIITGAGPGGGPHVQAPRLSGARLASFAAYTSAFAGGVYVAGVDIDGDGVDEIVTGPGAGGGPHVRVFGAGGPIGDGFFAFSPAFQGGVSVAEVGDDIIGPNLIAVGAGFGGGPHVRIVDETGTEFDGFYAYSPQAIGGVLVAGGVA